MTRAWDQSNDYSLLYPRWWFGGLSHFWVVPFYIRIFIYKIDFHFLIVFCNLKLVALPHYASVTSKQYIISYQYRVQFCC